MTELSAILCSEIQAAGSIPFDRFMELALYHPTHGYYRRDREKPRTGREGDFFTSVSVGPLFGRLLARQFLQMWEGTARPGPFWIIEQGAEDAQLACDILSWCRAEASAFFEAIHYAVIGEGASRQLRQREKLEAGGLAEKVTWFHSPREIPGRAGVFFSNELADAFPVHRVAFRKGTWRELQVVTEEDGFAWIEKPIEDPDLAEAIRSRALPAVEGYTTEIASRAGAWMEEVGRALPRGYVVTIDYGFPASIYYAPFRMNGTLTAYLEHRRTEEVLADPGGRDITAHVDFTGLARAGEQAGLATLGFLDQQHFLMGVAHDELSGAAGPRTGLAENLRAWQTLTHPDYLGTRFQVLVQAKDAPSQKLDGLRFARPGGLD